MPDDDEELFDHTVTPWTLGDLRKAVKDAEGLPDDQSFGRRKPRRSGRG